MAERDHDMAWLEAALEEPRPDPATHPWAAREFDLRKTAEAFKEQGVALRMLILTQSGAPVVGYQDSLDIAERLERLSADCAMAQAAHSRFFPEWHAAGCPA